MRCAAFARQRQAISIVLIGLLAAINILGAVCCKADDASRDKALGLLFKQFAALRTIYAEYDLDAPLINVNETHFESVKGVFSIPDDKFCQRMMIYKDAQHQKPTKLLCSSWDGMHAIYWDRPISDRPGSRLFPGNVPEYPGQASISNGTNTSTLVEPTYPQFFTEIYQIGRALNFDVKHPYVHHIEVDDRGSDYAIKWGSIRIVIDKARGAVREFSIYGMHDELMIDFCVTKYCSVKGFALPSRITRTLPHIPRGKLVSHISVLESSYQINSLNETNQFRLTLVPGCWVHDRDKGDDYIIPQADGTKTLKTNPATIPDSIPEDANRQTEKNKNTH